MFKNKRKKTSINGQETKTKHAKSPVASANCPVREMSNPRVGASASCPVTDSIYRSLSKIWRMSNVSYSRAAWRVYGI